DGAAGRRVGDVVEVDAPQPAAADLGADAVGDLVEAVGGDEVEVIGVRRVPGAVLGTQELGAAGGTEGEVSRRGDAGPRGSQAKVARLDVDAADLDGVVDAVGQAGHVHRRAGVGLVADVDIDPAAGVGRRWCGVVRPGDDGDVLGERVGDGVLVGE